MVLTDASLDTLAAALGDRLIRPGDPTYDTARSLWNGAFDKRPDLIVRCADVSDVVRAIDFARSNGLNPAIRGGGHSASGRSSCDGGLVIDLSPMKELVINRQAMTAVAGAGLTLVELVDGLQAEGLITTMGIAPTTGISGLTLGGGEGWLMGKYGLAIDNVVAFEVVTADGRLVTASAGENPDLFWALRGGGGNFGVVTSFTYRVYELGPVLAGMAAFPAERATEILRFYRDFTAEAPDDLTAFAGLLSSPEGHPLVAIALCYAGDLDLGRQAVQPVKDLGPILDVIDVVPYTQHQHLLDPAFPWGRNYYFKSLSVPELKDEIVERLVERGNSRPTPITTVVIEHCHGLMSRVKATDTAYPHRYDHYSLELLSAWDEAADAEACRSWTRALYDELEPYGTGVYVNTLGADEDNRIREAYGENFDRLAQVKAKWDPENFLRLNANVSPAH